MNEREEREQRWLAYFLDELPPEERADVEAELRASPAVADEYRAFVEAVSAWAKEPVSGAPLSVECVCAAAEPTLAQPTPNWRRVFRRAAWVGQEQDSTIRARRRSSHGNVDRSGQKGQKMLRIR